MRALSRPLLLLITTLVLLVAPGARAAWVETRVKAHTAIIDVERDGSAIVEHEIVLGVRGGPLRDLELQGVDADAEPFGEATVSPVVRYGVPTPIPVAVIPGEDGTVRLDVQNEKGLRTGSYTFSLRYRTNLLARDRIRRRGASAEIEWVGPRFADGIDVAKVVFRLPEGPTAPTLPSATDGDAALLGSAFLSSVRHDGGKAEVEVVRPHVARGEPAVWRVLASLKAFDGLPDPVAAPERPKGRLLAPERPRERAGWLLGLLATALVYGLLLVLKWSVHSSDCVKAHAEPRALVQLPVGARAALSGVLLALATALFALGDHPSFAAVTLLASMALAALRAPRCLPVPRGPGQWLALTDSDAFAAGRSELPRGRWLDAGTWRGALLLLAVASAVVVLTLRLAPRSPYHALALSLVLLAFMPIFATGRGGSLPVDRARAPRRFLGKLARLLRRRAGLKAVAWARIPDGSPDPDELRVLVRCQQTLDGLIGIEIGVEYQLGPAGALALPYVLVRTRAESRAQGAFPRGITWQRGRKADESVAVFRPALPTVRHTAALTREIIDQVSATSATTTRKASGVSALTSKVGVRSPAHAT